MKLSLSNLDIKVCTQELKNAIGARVDKVYELDGVFLLRLRIPRKGRQDLVIEPGRRIHLTSVKYRLPKRPSAFAMLLRKHLANSRLSGVEQVDFERVVELGFRGRKEYTLVAELFGTGNLVLCDERRVIVRPWRTERWRYRTLKSGERYAYPPRRGLDVRSLDLKALREVMADAPDVVRGLASNLGIGGQIAEEICARAKVDKRTQVKKLSGTKLRGLLKVIDGLLSQEPTPQIVYRNDEPIDVLPFNFVIYTDKRTEQLETFNRAIDKYFSKLAVRKTIEEQKTRFEREVKRLRSRLAKQEVHLTELEGRARELKKRADFVTSQHERIDQILRRLMGLRRAKGWKDAIRGLKRKQRAGEEWAKNIKSVRPHAGEVEVKFPRRAVTLDLRLSAFENASRLYEKYKRARRKASGAREAVARTRKELDDLRVAGVPEPVPPVVRERRKPRWFERYRWFYSSDDMLVIAGRDAATNREVVEKHMQPDDLYLHADIVGAPHVVIKAGGKEVPETTLEEAARFAGMHSRAWRRELGAADAYWVNPDQVSKEAPPGKYLPRGSYMIRGKHNYRTVPLEAAVGFVDIEGEGVVMCGPPSAIRHHSKVLVRVVPGRLKKSD
ncbi:MAG: ribosome rescue protein RqcH, partial [Candidatus Hadarchaeota archaeon]|nr:ribosome rescue protein RqcH [Candidatus Hadarchaeota archaeon]